MLGKGTYGVVYAGRERHTRVRIAIKEIPEQDSRCGERRACRQGARVGGAGVQQGGAWRWTAARVGGLRRPPAVDSRGLDVVG